MAVWYGDARGDTHIAPATTDFPQETLRREGKQEKSKCRAVDYQKPHKGQRSIMLSKGEHGGVVMKTVRTSFSTEILIRRAPDQWTLAHPL